MSEVEQRNDDSQGGSCDRTERKRSVQTEDLATNCNRQTTADPDHASMEQEYEYGLGIYMRINRGVGALLGNASRKSRLAHRSKSSPKELNNYRPLWLVLVRLAQSHCGR
jgi:hypothetical protein